MLKQDIVKPGRLYGLYDMFARLILGPSPAKVKLEMKIILKCFIILYHGCQFIGYVKFYLDADTIWYEFSFEIFIWFLLDRYWLKLAVYKVEFVTFDIYDSCDFYWVAF